MTPQTGRNPSEDRHTSRPLTSDARGRFIGLGRAYAEYLYDYAQGLTADPVIAGEVVENALTAAAGYFEHADFGQVRADRARADRVRARRADLSRIGSWSEQAQIWAEDARADADPAGQSAPGRRAAESIRPWLYATVRRECKARIHAAGGRLRPSGRHAAELAATAAGGSGASRSAAGGPWAEEAVADALTAEFEVTELQAEEIRVQVAAVNQVLSGLPEEASEILGLAVRHGLGDADIAVAMGMSRRRAAQERAEAAARFGRLAVTVLLLHAGWSGCERLDKMLGGSYPTTEPPGDKLCVKVSRHSENCMICGRIVASRGFGPELLSVLAIGRLPRPVRQQLSRISRELGRAGDSQPEMPGREQARRRARAGRVVPPPASGGQATAAADARAVSAGAAGTEGAGGTGAGAVGADAGGDEAAGEGAAEATGKQGRPAAGGAGPASGPAPTASPASSPDSTAGPASGTADTDAAGARRSAEENSPGLPGAGGSAGAGGVTTRPPWDAPTTIDTILPAGPAFPGTVTIGAGSEHSGSWLTRPRAAVVSALAILVIVAGIVLAGRIAAAPATHPDSRPSPAADSTPSPAASGTAPSTAARASQHARKRGHKTTSAPPGVLPSTLPATTPPAAHSSSPSSPKPSPSPTKSKTPSPPPPSSTPPSTTPTSSTSPPATPSAA